MLAAQSSLNDITLKSVLHEGLNPILQTELAYKEGSLTLSEYITLAIKIDNLMCNQPCSSSLKHFSTTASSPVTSNWMSPYKLDVRGYLRRNASTDKTRGYAFIVANLDIVVTQLCYMLCYGPNKTRALAGSSQRLSITFNSISSHN